MRAPLVAIGFATGFVLVSCTDQPKPAISEPEFSHLTFASSTCDFNGFNSLIAQYFSQPRLGTVQNLKQQMQDAFLADNETTITTVRERGFDILANIEAAVNTGTAGPPTVGAQLAHEVLECMFTPSDLPVPFPDAHFVEELTPLPTGLGAFGVRAGTTDPAGPIFARDGFSGIAPPPTSSWSQVLSERMLLYGSRPSSTDLSYDWDRIRTNATYVDPGPVVGLCTTAGPNSLVQHDDAEVLAWVDPTYFLTCTPPTTVQASGWHPRALVRQLVSLLSPQPLQAAVVFGHTSSGSRLPATHLDVEATEAIVLQFTQEMPSSFPPNTPVTVKVKATATVRIDENTVEVQPFLNATIVLQTVTTTNKGSNVVITGNTAVTELVDGDAIATFTESFNKTGVYKQVATVAGLSLGDRTTAVTYDTTSAFTVRGK